MTSNSEDLHGVYTVSLSSNVGSSRILRLDPPLLQDSGLLFLGSFVRFGVRILGFCSGMILIVPRQGFSDLFRRELAVIFRMQYVG
jgi:hypothetical protein